MTESVFPLISLFKSVKFLDSPVPTIVLSALEPILLASADATTSTSSVDVNTFPWLLLSSTLVSLAALAAPTQSTNTKKIDTSSTILFLLFKPFIKIKPFFFFLYYIQINLIKRKEKNITNLICFKKN